MSPTLMTEDELISRVPWRNVSESDFVAVLASHFGLAGQETGGRVVEYFERRKTDGLPVVVTVGDTPPVALSLHYRSRDFALSRVVPGPALTLDDIETIGERLAALTKVVKRPIYRRVLYTSVPAHGYWSHRGPFGEILLLPPPPDAPRIEWVLGSHPIALEFAVEESGDTSVDRQRRERTAREIGLVLSGVQGQIYVPDRWPEQQWAMVEKEAVYVRPGYETYGQGENSLPGVRSDFSPYTASNRSVSWIMSASMREEA